MKSEKGITLTSLAIYIIVVFIVIAILATITASLEGTIRDVSKEGINNSEIDKFNVYFLKEIKKQGNSVKSINNNTEIIFTTNNKYTFKNKKIYLNDNIEIATSIERCNFSQKLVDGKNVITVTIKAKNIDERNIDYVLSNESNPSTYEDEEVYIDNTQNNI